MSHLRKFFLAAFLFAATLTLATTTFAVAHQTSDVLGPLSCEAEGESCQDFGHAKLIRDSHSLEVGLQTSGLEPGAVITIWWVIFNNPEFCAGACGADDVSNPDVAASVLWAAGNIADDQGRVQFQTVLVEGNPPGEVISGPGLLSADSAEAHVVVRTHGQPIPALLEAQLTTLGGGCEINACVNLQFAIFP